MTPDPKTTATCDHNVRYVDPVAYVVREYTATADACPHCLRSALAAAREQHGAMMQLLSEIRPSVSQARWYSHRYDNEEVEQHHRELLAKIDAALSPSVQPTPTGHTPAKCPRCGNFHMCTEQPALEVHWLTAKEIVDEGLGAKHEAMKQAIKQPTPDAGEKPDALKFIRRLDQKYRMVCSGDLTQLQIVEAQAKNRFFVDLETACGYALVPWELSTPKDRDRELSIACASLLRSEVQAELAARGIDTAPAFERVKAALRAAGGGGERK